MGTFSDNLGRLSNLDSLFPVVRTFYFHVHGMFIQYQIRLVMRNFLPGDLPERLSYEKKMVRNLTQMKLPPLRVLLGTETTD